MLDRELEFHLKKIKAQQNGQQVVVQLLIHHILETLETKDGGENFTQELIASLEGVKTQK